MSFFEYLPAYELNRSPRIIVAYEVDFLRNLEAFQRSIPRGEKFTMLLLLGWSGELPEVYNELKVRLADAKNAFPEARFVIIANTEEEIPILKEFSEVLFAHQNAFLDPWRYPLAKKGKREHDALYIARITPFKRHYLAKNIRNLHLIGNYAPREKEYFEETMKDFTHARWTQKISSYLIGREICKASCGLALSAIEGAMLACGEYSLCGIPVVNTRNKGGRDVLLPDFAVKFVDDTPESVAEAVDYWVNNPVDPAEIRQGFLAKAQPHREALQEFVNTIAGKKVSLPHKLNVRRRIFPLAKLLHGIRRIK